MTAVASFGFSCWVLGVGGADSQPARFEDPERLERIRAVLPQLDALYERQAIDRNYPGFVYGVVVDGQLMHSRVWGRAHLEPDRPVEEDTRFRIASMTKSFTALAILKLRDAGKLALDDAVARYVPRFEGVTLPTADSAPVTIRHLLKMTAGFPQDDPWGDRRLADSVAEFERLLSGGLEYSNPPGVTWEYSNLGYALLGQVIASAAGRPYQEYITTEIFLPLGMTNTVWEYDGVPSGKLAQGYRWERGRWNPEPLLHDGTFGAMGGLITTLGDFARYQAFHLDAWPPRDGEDSGPVRRSTRREMHRPAEVVTVVTNNPTRDGTANPRVAGYSYGLSWNRDARGAIWLRHAGGLPGYGSDHRFMPEYGVGLIAFANRTYAPMWEANAEAMELLVTAARIPPRKPVVSAILARRAEQLATILQTWDPATVAEALAPNFFEDRSERDWREEAGEMLTQCGPIRSVTPVRAENRLRGRFDLVGERGRIEVYLTLMPERPPKVQEARIALVRSVKGELAIEGAVTHGYATNSGVKIHYASLGAGPLVAMIHGFPDYWLTWRHQMEALAKDHRVVAIDQRGYNLSDRPKGVENYAMELLVGDVAAVIKACGAERATVVGHDWGGAVAWTLAMTRPELVEKLVILNLPHPRGLMRELAHNPQQQANSAYARGFQQPGAHMNLTAEGLAFWVTDAEARPRYVEAFQRSDFEALLNYYKRNYPREPYVEDASPVAKVKCPVLMIHGLNDTALLPGALNGTWEWIEKDLTLVTVPGAGHWVQQDATALVNRTIRSWLGR